MITQNDTLKNLEKSECNCGFKFYPGLALKSAFQKRGIRSVTNCKRSFLTSRQLDKPLNEGVNGVNRLATRGEKYY